MKIWITLPAPRVLVQLRYCFYVLEQYVKLYTKVVLNKKVVEEKE
jgi:hypothetical protein